MARDRRALPLQVREGVRQFLADEGLRPGDRLPTEEELVERFEVSRSTLREALRLLEQDGVLEVRHGNGRYLSALPIVERPITRLEGMTELLQGMGYEVSDRVLSVSVGPPNADESAALRLRAAAEVIHLERIRMQGSEPLTYSAVAIPRSLFPGSVSSYDWSTPLHQLLDTLGHRTAAANTQIKAATLPRQIARSSGLPASVPYLLLVQTIVSRSGVFLIYAHDYMRGDHFSYDVRRVRDQA
jgi:GntR family transcriptional regulator